MYVYVPSTDVAAVRLSIVNDIDIKCSDDHVLHPVTHVDVV